VRLLFIGDIVGTPGINIVLDALPGLRIRDGIDVVIANGENADKGSGITPAIYRKLIGAGIDCITLGDHIYRKRDIINVLETNENIVKPANFPLEAPGKTWTVVRSRKGQSIAVISLIGRVFMKPVDCPFHAIDKVLQEIPSDLKTIFVDFHAEATSDKQLMGRYLDGRVSAVIGTHTHVTTADEQILPGGTAFQCDVGMTGPHNSILGRDIERVMETTVTFRPCTYHVATRDNRISATQIDIDPVSGKATKVKRVKIDEDDCAVLQEMV
jgi:2',3'-cyclic-nucleotide 2'-phosphodiesterase